MNATQTLPTIDAQTLSLALIAMSCMDAKSHAMELRNEFNASSEYTPLLKIAFPQISNIEPTELDQSDLSGRDVSVRTQIIEAAEGIFNAPDAAFAILALLRTSGSRIASSALEDFKRNDTHAKRAEIAFPQIAHIEHGEADSYDLNKHDASNLTDAAVKNIAQAFRLGLPA